MRKQLITIFISILLISGFIHASKDILLKIPVHVYKHNKYVDNLTKRDFSLLINGKTRRIEKVLTKQRSIGIASENKRSFVLQFNLTDYGKNISEGIKFFVEKILNPGDYLIIWTPIKVYTIKTNKSKNQIFIDLETIVKNDSLNYKKLREGSREKLLNVIRKFLGSDSNGKDSNSTATSIYTFLNGYSREWLNFKTKYLTLDPTSYYKVFSFLEKISTGEKFFINFQQREVIPALQRYNTAKRVINNYLSSVAGTSESSTNASISTALKKIDKSLLITDNFNPKTIISPFKGSNVSNNVILFHSFRMQGSNADSVSPDLEGILRKISFETGGLCIDTTDIKDGLKKISGKTDYYYNLVYKFDGKKGKKLIKVEVNAKEVKVFYKDYFSEGEIDTLLKMSSIPTINISNVKLIGHKLGFTISGFLFDKKKDNTGLVKVDLKLIDKKGNSVMNKGNTLRAGKKSVNINLTIVPERKGFFKLTITAKDMNTGKETVFAKYIELK